MNFLDKLAESGIAYETNFWVHLLKKNFKFFSWVGKDHSEGKQDYDISCCLNWEKRRRWKPAEHHLLSCFLTEDATWPLTSHVTAVPSMLFWNALLFEIRGKVRPPSFIFLKWWNLTNYAIYFLFLFLWICFQSQVW